MTHYCPHCDRNVGDHEISERGRHNICRAQVVKLLPLPESWWARHGWSVGKALLALGLAVVIVVNFWSGL